MKHTPVILVIILILFSSCRKEQISGGDPATGDRSTDSLSLTTVRTWFEEQSRLQTDQNNDRSVFDRSMIGWNAAHSYANGRLNYWLVPLPGQPTLKKKKQGFRKLAFMKDSAGNLQGRILEFIPDALSWQRQGKITTADYSGYMFIFDLKYHFIAGKIYSGGKQIGESRPATTDTGIKDRLTTQQAEVVADCYWVDSNYLDAEGNVVIHSDRICNYTIYDDNWYPNEGPNPNSDPPAGDPIGGGSAAGGPPAMSNLPGETNDKIDPKEYVRCFGSVPDAGSTMTVTLYVQQPFPGTIFNIGPNSVGHVAVGLSKKNGTTAITQTVGYYPDADGLKKFRAPSKVVDNGGSMDFNQSITYTVSLSQFQAVLDYVNTPPPTYDIVANNCTTFAINALLNGGITPPNSYAAVGMDGAGGVQTAMTPAALGNNIALQQGKPGINTSGGSVPASKGPCK